MTLEELKPKEQGTVLKIAASDALKRRIMDMGITKGCSFLVQKAAPLGDPVEIRIRGCELTLRKSECSKIQVEKIEEGKKDL